MTDVTAAEPQDDEASASDTPADAGLSAEEAVLNPVAEATRWKPKDQWKGDPDKWVDAKTFLISQGASAKNLKDQVKRLTAMQEQLVRQAHEKGQKEAEQRLAEAIEVGDAKAAKEAAHDLSKPLPPQADPQVSAWVTRNTWFLADEEANDLAQATAARSAKAGDPVSVQLEKAEAAVRKRFPEHFPDARQVKAPPSVQGGAGVVRGRRGGTGWADIPQNVREDRSVKAMMDRMELTEADYAKSYFADRARRGETV